MNRFTARIQSMVSRTIHAYHAKKFQARMSASGIMRPSSYPYISADSFRAIADHVYDPLSHTTAIGCVRRGDIVYVNTDYQEQFFQDIHPRITEPYVLITHDGIAPFDTQSLAHIDDKILHWFAKNVLVSDERVTPIPIGLEDLHRFGSGTTQYFPPIGHASTSYKKNKILFRFKTATNILERTAAQTAILHHPCAETFPTKLPPSLYLKKLKQYAFVISPPGAGEECHRTWEALYMGTIPIVRRSVGIESFAAADIPLWIVDTWEEILSYGTEELVQLYAERMQTRNDLVLSMDYWIRLICTYASKTFESCIHASTSI